MASLTRPAATRYCWIAATTAALLLAAVVAVNLVVDPFGMYRLVVLEGVNASKPVVQTRVRLVKAYEVRRLRPRGIILGTSRSHVGLRPSHDGWDPAAKPIYNLAFDGATTKEMSSICFMPTPSGRSGRSCSASIPTTPPWLRPRLAQTSMRTCWTRPAIGPCHRSYGLT